MEKATFQIAWDGDPSWMNIWNLLICLQARCPNTYFEITGTSADGSPIVTSGGPTKDVKP